MTTKRGAAFDLRAALRDPGFTPRAADVTAVLEVFAEGGDLAKEAERSLLRLGAAARDAAVEHLAEGSRRPAVVRLLGRFEVDAETSRALVAALADGDARVRKAAAIALGKARAAGTDDALASALASEKDAPVRRALVEAIGKVGGDAARGALDATDSTDPEVARERSRASLMLERDETRRTAGDLDLEASAASPIVVALRCRAGIEPLLLEELPASLRAGVVRGGLLGTRVEATLRGAPRDLFAARTWLSFGFPLSPRRVAGDDLAAAIVASLTSPQALALLRSWTRGTIRYRLSFRAGGKRRAVVWRVAEETRRLVPDLVNDPQESPWEAVVHEGRGEVQVELVPKADDPRFAYRMDDVPAASHPTIAAALVRAAGVDPHDVVWDPFTGSGTELCERAAAGPYRALVGSDHDPRALAVARTNVEAAGAHDVLLVEGDATRFVPPGAAPSLIVTNPPLGRRVQRSASLGPLLDRFVAHASRVLAPGGRIAWISPFPDRTRDAAIASHLTVARALEVDLGGFAAELQVLRSTAGAPRAAHRAAQPVSRPDPRASRSRRG